MNLNHCHLALEQCYSILGIVASDCFSCQSCLHLPDPTCLPISCLLPLHQANPTPFTPHQTPFLSLNLAKPTERQSEVGSSRACLECSHIGLQFPQLNICGHANYSMMTCLHIYVYRQKELQRLCFPTSTDMLCF